MNCTCGFPECSTVDEHRWWLPLYAPYPDPLITSAPFQANPLNSVVSVPLITTGFTSTAEIRRKCQNVSLLQSPWIRRTPENSLIILTGENTWSLLKCTWSRWWCALVGEMLPLDRWRCTSVYTIWLVRTNVTAGIIYWYHPTQRKVYYPILNLTFTETWNNTSLLFHVIKKNVLFDLSFLTLVTIWRFMNYYLTINHNELNNHSFTFSFFGWMKLKLKQSS